MYPFLSELSEKANVAISCYPNAGLPNPLSPTGFDLGPADMARYLGEFARGGLINIAGGCCGNTPEHIAAIAKALEGLAPREPRVSARRRGDSEISQNAIDVATDGEAERASPPVGIAALHAASRRLHHDRRADQRGRFAEVRQAGQGKANTKRRSASPGSKSRMAPTSSTSAWTKA